MSFFTFETGKLGATNITLIDNSITQADVFFNSTNEDTLAILYDYNCDKAELLTFLQTNFTTKSYCIYI